MPQDHPRLVRAPRASRWPNRARDDRRVVGASEVPESTRFHPKGPARGVYGDERKQVQKATIGGCYDTAKRHLNITGRTEDGRPVVEFFSLVESQGVPLETILDLLVSQDMVPDWFGFWRSARAKNWTTKTIQSKLETAIGDVYGPVYLEEWKKRFEKFLEVWTQNEVG